MIPAILHYCWFGPEPEAHPEFRRGFAALHPNWKLMRWSDDNFRSDSPYYQRAKRKKKYAYMSDYGRLLVLERFGGVYVDTDVRARRPLDSLLQVDFFIGKQPHGLLNNAIFGSVAGHWFLRRLLDEIERFGGGKAANLSSPDMVTAVYRSLPEEKKRQLAVLSANLFYPYDWEGRTTPNSGDSFREHLWDKSW